VRADDHGGPPAEIAQQAAERHPLLGVQAGGRLVQQQQFRFVHDRLRDADPAQHPAGQRAQLGPGLVPQAHVLDRGGHRARHPPGRHVLEQREVLDEVRDREARVVAESLRQVAEPASDLPPRPVLAGIAVQQPQLAAGRRDHRGHHPQQRGLARAVGPQQPEHSRPGLQAHPRHGLGPAELPGQVRDVDVHVVPLGIRVAYHMMAQQQAANAR
jgi:hypothetical protein